MPRSWRPVAVLAAVALSGCPSFQTLKTARALDRGEFQMTAAPEFELVSVAGGGTFSFPEVEVAGRYGVVDGFDLGLKLSTSGGADLESTIQLLKGPFDLALAPSVGFYGFGIDCGSAGSGGWIFVPMALPVLMGVNFGEHQLVFGPKLYATYISAGASTGSGSAASANGVGFEVGGTLGFSLKLGSSFRMMPSIDVLVPVAGAAAASANGASTSQGGFATLGSVIFQGGLAFAFGDDGFAKPTPAAPR